jgi:hypothetical protein
MFDWKKAPIESSLVVVQCRPAFEAVRASQTVFCCGRPRLPLPTFAGSASAYSISAPPSLSMPSTTLSSLPMPMPAAFCFYHSISPTFVAAAVVSPRLCSPMPSLPLSALPHQSPTTLSSLPLSSLPTTCSTTRDCSFLGNIELVGSDGNETTDGKRTS